MTFKIFQGRVTVFSINIYCNILKHSQTDRNKSSIEGDPQKRRKKIDDIFKLSGLYAVHWIKQKKLPNIKSYI